jgi:hypothetical protein
MLRAQTAAAALAAGLSVLSNFVAVALNPREHEGASGGADVAEAEPDAQENAAEKPSPQSIPAIEADGEVLVATQAQLDDEPEPASAPVPEAVREAAIEPDPIAADEHIIEVPAQAAEPPPTEVQTFDIAALPAEIQDLHRRANRVAKVAMQDIKLLRPKDVQTGREHNDLCERLRSDLDKARKEYDRRFRAISDHPVDYFHHWALEILAGGDRAALGEYPYPSPVLRH